MPEGRQLALHEGRRLKGSTSTPDPRLFLRHRRSALALIHKRKLLLETCLLLLTQAMNTHKMGYRIASFLRPRLT